MSSIVLLLALISTTPGVALAMDTSTAAGDTSVSTGDALSGANLTTTANTNTVETEATSTGSVAEGLIDNASSTGSDETTTTIANSTSSATDSLNAEDPTIASSTASTTASTTGAETGIASSTAIDNGTTTINSSASTTATATSSANTGFNVASSSGNVQVDTGNAVAYLDVLNVLNTTLVDADGLIQFINSILGIGDFDLSTYFTNVFMNTATAESTPACTLAACTAVQNYLSTSSTATIVNNLVVTAGSGGNIANGESTDITTGNAYASANLINVANTNIVDSQYLLMVFNDFSDLSGNLILPNSTFFNTLFASSPSSAANQVGISNSAIITNNATSVAESGSNLASGASSSVVTGAATALGTITNTVNQNIIGSNSFSMIIRVFGNWSGSVYGLPAGMSWEETPAGIRIFSTPVGSGAGGTNSTLNNSASVTNNVQVYALTGENYAHGNPATISTGNAYANASLMNLVNTNIIGSNWASLIFNIYGNWNGHLSFGQSDLWVGVRATSPDAPIMPGSPVTYTYTIFNQGDLAAHNVELNTESESGALAFSDSAQTNRTSAIAGHTLSIGTLAPGETREISETAYVGDELPTRGLSAIPLKATVTGDEPDSDGGNNSDTVTITIGQQQSRDPIPGGSMDAKVSVTKTANKSVAKPGETITYTIGLKNSAGTLYDAALVDILEDSSGNIVNKQVIPLDDLKNEESFNVSYDIVLSNTMATGTYKNSAQVVGFQGSSNIKYQQAYSSPVATHTLVVGSSSLPQGLVLGASDSCSPYLNSYLRRGNSNSSREVSKLQTFLSQELGRTVAVTGIFDAETETAVRAFQEKYASEVLTPWQIKTATGYVYYTTQKKINERYCKDIVSFPLTPAQRLVIAKATTPALRPSDNSLAKLTKPNRPLPKTDKETKLEAGQVKSRVKSNLTLPDTAPVNDYYKPNGFIRTLFDNWFEKASRLFSLR